MKRIIKVRKTNIFFFYIYLVYHYWINNIYRADTRFLIKKKVIKKEIDNIYNIKRNIF
jgi:hypothetical protein